MPSAYPCRIATEARNAPGAFGPPGSAFRICVLSSPAADTNRSFPPHDILIRKRMIGQSSGKVKVKAGNDAGSGRFASRVIALTDTNQDYHLRTVVIHDHMQQGRNGASHRKNGRRDRTGAAGQQRNRSS